MKKTLLLAVAVALLGLTITLDAFAQRNNGLAGRDNFGYQWHRNDTIGGTPYSWVDISTTGTPVTGLGDDNFVGPIPIGFDFTYYWNTYNQVYVGSNGYIMFGRGENVASGTFSGLSGMPPFPFQDSKNNYIGALLADLTFINANGSPVTNAGVRYETRGTQFIITYNRVPFWTQSTSTQTSGANTFQIILDAADSSFVVQYQACTGTPFSGYTGNRTSRGFEDINGLNGSRFGVNIGLTQLANKRYTVKYPRNTTFQITDVSAEGVFNRQNGAKFLIRGASNNVVSAVVRNSGTADVTTPFNVDLSVEDANGNIVASGPVAVPSLARGAVATVALPALPATVPAGSYLVQIATNVAGDGVAINNNIAGEVVVVDTNLAPATYGYDGGVYPGTRQNFGGNALGVYYEFPNSPTLVTGTEFDMGWVTGLGAYQDSSIYRIRFHLPDANGNPGPAIDSTTIDYNTQLFGDSIGELFLGGNAQGAVRRHRLYLNAPLSVSGGIYLSITHIGRDNRFFWNRIMADSIAPFSNRIFEIQGGTWGADRNRAETDYSLRVLTRTIERFSDIEAQGVNTPEGGGRFLVSGASNNTVLGFVRNTGQNPITTPFTATISVEDENGTVVATNPVQIPSLVVGAAQQVQSGPLPSTLPVGTYTVRLTTTIPSDRNPNNNNAVGEVVIVDTTGQPSIYGFTSGAYGTTQSFAPYSFGTYFPLPSGTIRVTGAQFDMGWVNFGVAYQDSSEFVVRFHSDLGGAPGPAIDSVLVDYNSRFLGDSIGQLFLQGSAEGPVRRHTLFLNNPITITNGGFYLSMVYVGPRIRFFWNRPMANRTGPFARQSYTITNGVWSPAINREIEDYSLRLVTRTLFSSTNNKIPSASLVAYPNPATDIVTLQDKALNQVTSFQLINAQGIVIQTISGSKVDNGKLIISTSELAKGAYVIRANGSSKNFISRFVRN